MKLKPSLLLIAIGFLVLPLAGGTALADGGRGWDRGWWYYDRGHHHHHHRHHSGYWSKGDRVRHWDRWDRAPIRVYRDGRRYDRPWIERRTVIYGDRRW
jgi:hypothetical protein